MLSTQGEEALTAFTHDLFLNTEYVEWRKSLKSFSSGEWHLVAAALERFGAPVGRVFSFGESIGSTLFFNYTKAPDHNESQMLMVQFTVAGSMWHSVIWHCPERN
ncbi:hypothetical protein PSm6_34520 [Pseudomonas solani]|uniref:Uncharacterized protein n=1 Tax=Pseudomonas solani TaxID=2731552 RepID=A0ABM7LBR7_9PSED|nr:hypothetical protein [Pseudomonas solani]BCD87045.1 hypothetical protein PSm6_34520 [Pseudomonas solani]